MYINHEYFFYELYEKETLQMQENVLFPEVNEITFGYEFVNIDRNQIIFYFRLRLNIFRWNS